MCHYCGCREIPLIKDFVAEHESVTNLAGGIVHALDHGRAHTVRGQLDTLARELASHWRGEETGLFAVMRGNPEFTDYVDRLEAEHRELAALLAAVDLTRSADRTELAAALGALHQHIAKEEDGLFPASLIALTAEDWDRSMAAWRAAHAGRTPAP
ncbi:hemerythrin domain-containing protein [Kitasatospora sp. NPDC057015]|uniref:hemerythrin domain-containing protein n=1 Tax=Kitasatospora sp. NPDC057015 TaxID=3346001 RepID=UPI003634C3C2